MAKTVALIGHCGPDSSFLRMAVSSADRSVQVVMADDSGELSKLLEQGVDLLLFNREMPYGFDDEEGVGLIRKLRVNHPGVKMMLVSNYPDAQAAAVAAGALPGFGKREIGTPRVAQVIREALGDAVEQGGVAFSLAALPTTPVGPPSRKRRET